MDEQQHDRGVEDPAVSDDRWPGFLGTAAPAGSRDGQGPDEPGPAAPPPPPGPFATADGPGVPDAPEVPAVLAPGRAHRRRRGALLAGVAGTSLVLGVGGGVAGAQLADGLRGGGDIAVPPSLTSAAEADAEAPSREAGTVAGVAAQVLPSTVAVEVLAADGLGTGSGFVISEDGLLLTNNHVIASAADGGGTISVTFVDGSTAEAELVGRTVRYDLAVLRVDRTGLVPLEFADSSDTAVGDTVVAVGAPLGLQATVTSGIVSALDRPVTAGQGADSSFMNAVQTDAAINPGNSGGPLVDLDGKVVGVNSAIAQTATTSASAVGGSIGLGFAIPATQAVRTAEEIIETGVATYPVIGVALDPAHTGEGVAVAAADSEAGPAVVPDGPADRAGLRAGDVILAFEGRPITENSQLIVAITAQRPGDTVTLTVRRDGETRDVDLVLDEQESD